ncbi:MAG: hypothetical protein ACR2OG_03095 [Gemmatimonadaceae bacterium]
MRTMLSRAALLRGALAASLVVVSALPAQERAPYPATLNFGTGLVNIPVAWVSPRSGDVWLNTSGKTIDYADGLSFAGKWNTNIAIESHWLGRFSVGASAYSQNPEYGFFGQLLLLRDNGLLPSVAVGIRNVGKYSHEDRLLIGHDIQLQLDSSYKEVVSGQTQDFSTAPTVYGVATKELGSGSVSIGYGNGLFKETGNLGRSYNDKGTVAKGLFFGARYALRPTETTLVTFMGENDGFDWNAGVVGDWRGLYLGIYGTELEEGGRCGRNGIGSEPKGAYCRVYNYTKANVALGYSGNAFDIARGVLLRARVSELEREQTRLRLEIEARERRIAKLELDLRKAQAGELAELATRREALESQIRQEREAIIRAEERLRQLQQNPPPKPPATPPTTPPSGGHQAAAPRGY